jgi:hypothetical protein
MAKRYMGEKDPALDALYEQLDATGRETRADRRTRRQIERQIRKIRAGRLGGIRGLFRGLVDDVGQGLLRQHISQPQIDQFADETVAGKDVFPTPAQDVLGRNFGFRVPPTAAEVAPEIEEIEVTAEKRPEIVAEIVEDQWVPWKSLMRVSKQRELPVGTFSKKNQRYNPETRQWEIRVLPELMNEAGYAKGGDVKKSKARKFHEERMAALAEFDPTDPERYLPPIAGLTSLGGKVGLNALLKLLRKNPKDWQVIDAAKFSNIVDTSPARAIGTKISPREQKKLLELRRAIDAMNRPGRSPYSKPLTAYQKLDPEMQQVVGATTFAAAPTLPIVGMEMYRPIYDRKQKKRDMERWMAENESDRTRDLSASILDLPEEYRNKALSDLGLRKAAEVKDMELAEMLALSSIDIDGMSPEIQALIEAEQAGGYAHGGKLSGQADRLARAGRGDDTMLMHVTPDEVAGLASLAPGMMTINPETGLPEAGWFRNLLGTAAPFLMSMIPGIGPVLGGAMGGGIGSLIKGGDWKDAILGAGLGALGGKMFGGAASETGAGVLADETTAQALTNPEAFQGAIKFAPEPFVEAGITPELMSGKIVPAIQSGVNPTLALSQAGVNPEQLGVLKGSLSGLAKDALPDTLSQNIKNIRAGGLGGIKDALMSGSGLAYIGGTGLQLQHEGQEAHEDFLLAKEEADRQRERDIAAYYPENIPYLAREGGSIYKNRYINGNWS